ATPEEQVTADLDSQTRSRWLAAAMSELPDREQIIIRKRHLAENGATLEDLSHELGVSKERVRQLEKRALGKLQAIMVDRETVA
ncbi:sigma-70 family RNA polymerase sigma factor, partial [Hypericibacter sp.]|uniref:sigma-70 family RNA polymerase sigma factor n=1 Tax=Hypericibacter sp. TaxID=2705401 RepID=UPI003D6CE678